MDNNSCGIDNPSSVTEDNLDVGPKNEYIELEVPMDLLDHLRTKDSDVQKLCRICLTTNNDEMVSLIEIEELGLMFTALTSINVETDASFPNFICEGCKAQVIFCYEFKCRCTQSDFTLKTVLKGEVLPKLEQTEDRQELCVSKSDKVQAIDVDVQAIDIDVSYVKTEECREMKIKDELNSSDCIGEGESDGFKHVKNEFKQNKELFETKPTDTESLLQEVFSSYKRNRTNKKSFTCTLCSKKCYTVKSLRSHIELKHGTTRAPFGCKNCNEIFSSEHDLKLHSVLHVKGSKWKCGQCHKIFKLKSLLKRHIERHMERKRFLCAECDKTFTELYALRRHQRVHTGESLEKKHTCDICDKRFSDKSLLRAHMSRHSGARPFVCSSCGNSFTSARLLSSHQLVHSQHKPYACLYCDKRFRHDSTRNTHHRTHTGEKPFVCAVCGKTFIQNSNLTLHMRTHTGERPYSCKYCDSKFTSGSSLKYHERIHTGEKPYSCNICHKKFARMNMKAHMRLHTGERPFSCSICPKKFVTQNRLREHRRIHTGEKPFECATCPMKCTSRSHLVKHVKTHQDLKKIVNPQLETLNDSKPNKIVRAKVKNEKLIETTKDNVVKISGPKDVCDLEVTDQLVLEDSSDLKNEVLVVDVRQNIEEIPKTNWPSSSIVENNLKYEADVNHVTVNKAQVITPATGIIESTSVKLYQLDQSLVQIHSTTTGQVTISKITSKVKANF